MLQCGEPKNSYTKERSLLQENTQITQTVTKATGEMRTKRGKKGCESGRNVSYLKNEDDFMGSYLSKLTQMYIFNVLHLVCQL